MFYNVFFYVFFYVFFSKSFPRISKMDKYICPFSHSGQKSSEKKIKNVVGHVWSPQYFSFFSFNTISKNYKIGFPFR